MYTSNGEPTASVDLPLVVQSVGDAIVGETLDGTVVAWNRAAERLYGYPAAEMVGRPAARLYPPDEAAKLRKVSGGRPLSDTEYLSDRIRRDGTPVRVCVHAAPIVDGAGAAVGVATTSWAAGDEPAGYYLASQVGHDLRTPLNAILGFTGTLLMRLPGPLNDEQELELRLVRESAEQLLSRINELSRPGVG